MSKSELFRLKIQRGESLIPRYCTVRDMNYEGEILHGEFNDCRYILDDGDGYYPSQLSDFDVVFSDVDPRKP